MLTDLPVIDLSPKNYLVSAACGEDGVYQINPREHIKNISENFVFDHKNINPKQILTTPSNDVHWMYNTVFASGNTGKVGMAKYAPQPSSKAKREEKIDFYRNPKILETFTILEQDFIDGRDVKFIPGSDAKKNHKIISSNYTDDIITWGVEDKICSAKAGILKTYFYRPYRSGGSDLDFAGDFQLNRRLGDIISGNSTHFGYIIEFDEGIQIILADGSEELLMEPAVNWKCFTRSKNYTNQVHYIFEDRIEIISYNESNSIETKFRKIGVSPVLEVAGRRR